MVIYIYIYKLNFLFQTTLSEVPGKTLIDKLQMSWVLLQTHVNSCYDCDLDRLSTDKNNGIKQVSSIVDTE